MSIEQHFYSGVTGLRGFQTKLDSIGNNIANVGTTGFKRGDVQFEESFHQLLQAARQSPSNNSFLEASEDGFGIGRPVTKIDNAIGNYLQTEQLLDLAIVGEGFFVMDKENQTFYSRDGNLTLDSNLNLVQQASGSFLNGWTSSFNSVGETVLDFNRPMDRLAFGNLKSMPFKPTGNMVLGSNLDTNSRQRDIELDQNVFNLTDKQGKSQTMKGTWQRLDFDRWLFDVEHNGKKMFSIDVEMHLDGQIRKQTIKDKAPEIREITGENGQLEHLSWTYPAPLDEAPDTVLPMTLSLPKTAIVENGKSGFDFAVRTETPDRLEFIRTPTQAFVNTYRRGGVHETRTTVVDSGGKSHDLSLVFEHVDEKKGIFEYRVYMPEESPSIQAWLNDPKNGLNGRKPNQNDLESANDFVFGPSRHGKIHFNPQGTFDAAGSTIPQIQARLGDSSVAISMNTDLITGFAAPFSTSIRDQDGYVAGELRATTITSTGDGQITGNYTNGERRILGQMGLAVFRNSAGLVRAGTNLFRVGSNAGVDADRPQTPAYSNRGQIRPGFLESSNVNIAEELTDMIITQRAYQASSRIVTTSDQLLQVGLGLKR